MTSELLGVCDWRHAIVLRGDDEHALLGHEARARERADHAVRRLERPVLERSSLASAEPALIAREVGDRDERNEGHDEREVALQGCKQRRRVTAEAHPHDAHAWGATIAEHPGER